MKNGKRLQSVPVLPVASCSFIHRTFSSNNDLLHCGAVDGVCVSVCDETPQADQARPVPGVCVPRRLQPRLHRMRQGGDANVKRRAIKVVVFLLLGAIVNVAVAWGDRIHGADDRFIAALLSVSRYAPPRTDPMWEVSGFPLHSLEMDVTAHYQRLWRGESYSWNGGIRISGPRWLIGRISDGLPLRPTWPGFAINTMFYAGVLWMVFAFPFVMRRRRRIKRGLCPACAYPVGGSPVCTECGAAIQPRPGRGDGM